MTDVITRNTQLQSQVIDVNFKSSITSRRRDSRGKYLAEAMPPQAEAGAEQRRRENRGAEGWGGV